MAGVSGNIAELAFAIQTGRGTPNTTYAHRTNLSGGNMVPVTEVDNLSETDSSRDQGISYVRQTSASGTPEVYVRDAFFHKILEQALGSKATTGTTDFTHTVTPANALPYVTVYRAIGALLFEQFNDCKVNELTISADTGGPLTAAIDYVGRSATRLAAVPGSLPTASVQAPYSMNDAAVTLAGGATSLVSSFELTISNNVTVQQTDDVIPYDVVEGLREVTLGFRLVFETLAEYNRAFYGSTTGTTQSSVLPTLAMVFTFTKSATNEISFSLPSVAYEDFPVDPDPGGDPIVVDVRARAQRGASPVVTAVVKNQTAT